MKSRKTLPRVAAVVATLMATTATLSGCGLGTAGGFAPQGELTGPLASVQSLDGASVAVGSKNFTEQIVLGKLAVILLKSAGASVQDYTNIPGSSSARQAMLDDQVQMEWEYTGTAWIAYLGHTDPITDPTKQYDAVRDEDLAQHALVWTKPAPMNNTYGFAIKKATADKLKVKSLADLAKVPAAQRTFCVESEFANRNDGLRPMLQTYGVPYGSAVKPAQVKTLDTGAIYAATASGLCNFGEVFTTDGRIKALNLTVLEDNKKFFPNYNVAAVFTKALITKYPQLDKLFAPVAAKLTDDTMIELNGQVDVEGKEPVNVAHDWLVKEGFISG